MAVVEDAHRLERHVASHVLSPEGIAYSVRAGVDAVERCTWILPKASVTTPRIVVETKAKGIYAGFNFTDRYCDALDAKDISTWAEFTSVPASSERKCAMRGCVFFLSTDADVPHMPHEDFGLAVEVGAWAMHLSPTEALLAATREPVRAIGVEEIGNLEVGKRAEIVALDGNPLEHLSHLRSVRAVLRDGEVVAERADGRTLLRTP